MFVAVAALPGSSFAAEPARWVVSFADGSVEVGRGSAESDLVETGSEVAAGDHVVLGVGANLSLAAVEGESKGRVVTLHGPAEGTLAELVAASSTSGVASAGSADALRTASTADLGAPELTRASTGPLRPVYPQGAVAVPLGDFLFVPDLENLDGAAFELRLFETDPSKPDSKPLATCKADGPQVDAAKAFGDLPSGRKYWWQVSVQGSDGETMMAGDPVVFTTVKQPTGQELPPRGFESPEQYASWRLMRAKALVKAQLHLDACREYLALAASGGGATVEKECRRLESKLALDDAARELLASAASRQDAAVDSLEMTDGRKLVGRVVSADTVAVFFQMTGTRYRLPASDVKDVTYGTQTALPSVAPFASSTSPHYVISTNAGRDFAKDAARHLEALFDVFSRMFGGALGARQARNLKVKIFRDDVDFAAFLAKDHPEQAKGQGFYFTGDSTLYLYRSFVEGRETTFTTLFHEATHQLLFMRCNQDPKTARSPQYWIMESLPCYMEGLEWRGNALVLERPPQSRVANFLRVREEGHLLPLKAFFALAQSGYGSADLYDQGTAVFWFMMRRDGGKEAAKFLGFVKDALSMRQTAESEKKAFPPSLAAAAEGYEDWFAKGFGVPAEK
jgi:hypothetical protein